MNDRRWKLVRNTMQKHQFSTKALLETLHTIQDSFGYIDLDAMKFVAQELKVPVSKVLSVATFYNSFTSKPAGEHTMVLCTGTACYVKGNDKMVEYMKAKHNLEPNQTTPDNKLSFVGARCVGACGLAPVMILDGKIMGKMTVEEMQAKVEEWLNNG
ncbi:MAG: NAD(P)H-dependent oxidoreductase subunit E [Anaerolineaceae bacterium]|nr:NAD(P)H-dependent oxidoreductase subunit E [Anaerolineaceae bacterium]